MMRDMLDEVLEQVAGEEWEAGYYGDTIICPCGNEMELDGECPRCGNPLKAMGMI